MDDNSLSTRYLLAIPVYNEARHVRGVVRAARQYVDELLVVDDGSTDPTPALLSGFDGLSMIRHEQNRGYGRSLIDAFTFAAQAGYDWLITMDCDEQHEPAALPDFIAALIADDADVISGSRYLRAFRGNDAPPSDRRTINRQITQLLNERLGLNITDAFCGFKAYRLAALRRMTLTEEGYALPMQFWAWARALNLRVRELPVRLVYHDPDRHFGGELDNPTIRYRHYLDVFEAQVVALRNQGLDPLTPPPPATAQQATTDQRPSGCASL